VDGKAANGFPERIGCCSSALTPACAARRRCRRGRGAKLRLFGTPLWVGDTSGSSRHRDFRESRFALDDEQPELAGARLVGPAAQRDAVVDVGHDHTALDEHLERHGAAGGRSKGRLRTPKGRLRALDRALHHDRLAAAPEVMVEDHPPAVGLPAHLVIDVQIGLGAQQKPGRARAGTAGQSGADEAGVRHGAQQAGRQAVSGAGGKRGRVAMSVPLPVECSKIERVRPREERLDLRHGAGGDGAVRPGFELVHDQSPAPFPRAGVGLALAGGVPAEGEAPPAVGGGLGGIEGAPVEGVVGRGDPGAGERVGQAVAGLHAVAELREDEGPAVAPAKEVGALVGEIETRGPERRADLPALQVGRGGERGAATAVGRAVHDAGGQEHPIFARLLVPKGEGVAPVHGVVPARIGAQDGVAPVFFPGAQVAAGGVADGLGDVGPRVAGVEEVEDAAALDDRPGPAAGSVRPAGSAGPDRYRPFLPVGQVGGDEVGDGRALRPDAVGRQGRLEVEGVKEALPVEGDDVADKAVGGAVEDGHRVLLFAYGLMALGWGASAVSLEMPSTIRQAACKAGVRAKRG
jgi:hypothetical protein